jgi:hypothetical protein
MRRIGVSAATRTHRHHHTHTTRAHSLVNAAFAVDAAQVDCDWQRIARRRLPLAGDRALPVRVTGTTALAVSMHTIGDHARTSRARQESCAAACTRRFRSDLMTVERETRARSDAERCGDTLNTNGTRWPRCCVARKRHIARHRRRARTATAAHRTDHANACFRPAMQLTCQARTDRLACTR